MELLAVAYHYIEGENKYPAGIYPTSPERFRGQLQLLGKKYRFISEADLLNLINGQGDRDGKFCLVTFDDALASQYEKALPILEELDIPALFFVSTNHFSGKAYAVHKIHYLLSIAPAEELLLNLEKKYLENFGSHMDWETIDLDEVLGWYRYDTENSAKFKFLLNHYLEETVADSLITKLFEQESNMSETDFCHSFYLSQEQMVTLSKHSLASIGLHTHRHISIPRSSAETIRQDFLDNFKVLNKTGGRKINGLSYPYGSITDGVFQEKIKPISEEIGLQYGFTTEKKINKDFSSPFRLGRFGTNDIMGGKHPIINL